MPAEILMPALSPTMTHGNLACWKKKVGDPIVSGDVLAEIGTDKATLEFEAIDEGTLGRIFIEDGASEIPVNNLIGLIRLDGESEEDINSYPLPAYIAADGSYRPQGPETDKSDADKSDADKHKNTPRPSPSASGYEVISPPTTVNQTGNRHQDDSHTKDRRLFVSPVARRISRERNIDLHALRGTGGPQGRIIKRDVENYVAQKNDKIYSEPEYDVIPISPMRRVVAKRLLESKNNAPHYYITVECHIDELLSIRKRLNDLHIKDGDYHLTVNDFIVRASALAIDDVKSINSSWHDTEIRQYRDIDISIAVALDGGLITPVVRQANKLGLIELSQKIRLLVEKARKGLLLPQDYQGGNFSISNLGAYPVRHFTAIINPPQSCILAIGQGSPSPVVKNGALDVATVLSCTLSCDHRVIDGAVGAEFLKHFKFYVENPLAIAYG